MPPRKPRARVKPRYQTGADYSTPDEPPVDPALQDGPDFLGEEPLPPSMPGRDLYGESDFPPEEAEDPQLFQQTHVGIQAPTPAGATPSRARAGETRVAPIPSAEEEPENTGVDSPDATRTGRPLKLEIVSGPGAGKVRRIEGVRCVIGRAPECGFPLGDQSASRKHAELVVSDEGVLLRDLESGNGTKVNGEKITERVLVHGDEISLGKTVLRFVDEVAAFKKLQEEAEAREAAAAAREEPPPAEQEEEPGEGTDVRPPPEPPSTSGHAALASGRPRPVRRVEDPLRKRRMLGLFAALAGAMVLLLVMLLRPARPPPPSEDILLREAMEKLQRARNAAREGHFLEAAELADAAQKLKPGVDTDGFAARARKEAEAEAALGTVRALMAEGKLAEARAGLERVQFVTPAGEAVKAQLASELSVKLREDFAARLEEALGAGDVEAAQGVLLEMEPGQLRESQPRVEALKARLAQEAEERLSREKVQKRRVAIALDAKRRAEVKAAFESVQRRFDAGEYARAALECDRVADRHPGDDVIRARASELKALLPAFGKAFEEGHRKFKAGQLGAAARPLKKARELYQQMGMEGSLGRILDEELGASALSAAEAAWARQDYAGANLFYEEARRLTPGDERAAAGIGQVNRRLEELYLQAYALAESDPKDALSKLRTVLGVVRPGQPLHDKATALKERIQK
ncbi:MAG: hypothetical protein RL653_952 [Pseudomonadota bacterium]|jgi:hypothetical protein